MRFLKGQRILQGLRSGRRNGVPQSAMKALAEKSQKKRIEMIILPKP